MTTTQDFAVAVMATAVGLFLILGALLNSARLMNLAKPRLLAEAIGSPAARLVVGCLGLAIIVIGLMIASGWRINW